MKLSIGFAGGLLCGLTIAGASVVFSRGDITPDPKLRANRNTYHPVNEVLKPKTITLTDAQIEKLKQFPIEAVWSAVQQQGYTHSHFSGMKSTRPTEKLVGRALTIRYLPRRPDLVEAMTTLAKEGD